MMGVIEEVLAYERERGEQKAGSLGETVLRRIAELAPNPMRNSVETGCGKSTVLLSQLSEHHVCFTLDDTGWYQPGDTGSSLNFVRQCPAFLVDQI
jgi:hypothetical protein